MTVFNQTKVGLVEVEASATSFQADSCSRAHVY
jgi:hypothetical protein